MRWLALLLISFGPALAIQCPDGFSDPQGTGNCYRFKVDGATVSKTRSSAQALCAGSNATLPSIRNLPELNSIYGSLPSGNAWLGLTCPTSDPLSCFWDDGTPLRDGDYQSFATGHPNPSIGTCIFMDVYSDSHTSKQWLSASCTTSAFSVCEYEHGLQYSLCPDGSRYFNGSCYFGMLANSVNDGINKCSVAGGNLASIHSDSENDIVFSVARLLEPADATFIGLKLSDNVYSWSDGTSVNYKNFGTENKASGNCVAMSLIDRIVEHGKWINSPCDSPSTPVNLVCKRPVGKTLVSKTVETLSICSSPIFLNGNGGVVSPLSNDANSCQYLVSVDSGHVANILFSQVSMDSNSTITLFNSIFDKNPFATITTSTNYTAVYKSTSNTLLMLYTTNGGSRNHFFGYFGENLPHFSNEDVYYGSGNFSSGGYPTMIAPSKGHKYRMVSTKNRIALSFKGFDSPRDVMYIYDGSEVLLDQISGDRLNYAVSSLTNSIYLVFMTSDNNMKFSAEFISIL